jgi:hypothetical protein
MAKNKNAGQNAANKNYNAEFAEETAANNANKAGQRQQNQQQK